MKPSISPRASAWIPVALMFALLAALSLGFSMIASAATSSSPPAVTDPASLPGMLLSGHYLPAIGAALVIIVGLLRSGGAKVWPWLGTKLGGYVLAYVTAYALYLGTAWQAGAPWDAHLLVAAFGAALMASGILDHWRDLLGAWTGGASTAARATSAAATAIVILGLSSLVSLGVASCSKQTETAIENSLWRCTDPVRADAVAAVTPAVVSVIKAAGSADGKMIDTSTVKAAITKANLLSEAGVLLSCALASAVDILEAPTPAPIAGAPAASPYVLDPKAVARMWAEINADQLGGAHFQVASGRVL